jgi:Transglycosylase SLT domain/D-alanyl-D-alanine carboxypeptidase/Putative Flp pilus-assembly TadE/G-like
VSARPAALLVSGHNIRGGLALAAALAVEAARGTRTRALLAEISAERARRPTTLLASPDSRELEAALRARGFEASARGHLCHIPVQPNPAALDELGAAAAAARAEVVVVHLAPGLWLPALDAAALRPRGGLLLIELPRERSLAALAVGELRRRGCRAKVVSRPPPPLAARRALAGVRPGGALSRRIGRVARALLREGGQALPAVLGAGAVLIATGLVLVAIGGAVTGEARAQRAADLAALSAARSMRDALPRLLAPPRLPDGSPNPNHLSRGGYLDAARDAASEAARRNGVAAGRLLLTFPDAESMPPLRARARIAAEIDPRELPGGGRLEDPRTLRRIPVVATAVAEAAMPGGDWTGMPARASGGGYSGPLTYRNGEGMRPDAGRAFDLMSAAARRDGITLVVNSGFRSDAEQARLFAAHPDPTWVAPPGRSLHRCATELDLGPSAAYGWLAANARRFGFVQRYSWEPWHYGFVAGPAPCSAAGESGGLGTGGPSDPDGEGTAAGLPAFVPARYRAPIMRSAGRWNVSGALLAAQLMAESGFDPGAVSPAGAQGIAQFMPGTAASYGLRNPFDAEAAIDAQAHLMSDLLRQFRSVPLALAAYNAGPGAVSACSCVGPYAETRAYVARILALLDGAGAALAPPLEVRLVR